MQINAFKDPGTIARVAANPLGDELEALATSLLARRYNRKTVCQYLRKLEAFGWWLDRNGIRLKSLSPAIIHHYLNSAADESGLGNGVQIKSARSALSILMAKLYEDGKIAQCPAPPETELRQWLQAYETHMQNVHGLAYGTRRHKLRFACKFLYSHSDDGRVEWASITADSITQFILSDVSARRGTGPQNTTAAIRGLLRFLISHSVLPAYLEHAVPRTRRWSHAAIPNRLSKVDVAKIVKHNSSRTPMELRNFAIILLLLGLGLRSSEVRNLELNDVDWHSGSILLRAGKVHRERRVPLPEDVGSAIVEYLRYGRPNSDVQKIFIAHSAPFLAFKNSSAIWHITRKLLKTAKINCPSGGAHILRHTAASLMVNHGASFKEVADVLGHRRLHTTAVYAKLDVLSLSAVAMPWPGSSTNE